MDNPIGSALGAFFHGLARWIVILVIVIILGIGAIGDWYDHTYGSKKPVAHQVHPVKSTQPRKK